MKRAPELVPVSHDHQRALEAALRLRRAEPGDVDAAAAYFEGYWRERGERHFEIEEEIILPALPAGGEWDRARGRVLDEHARMRMLGAALQAGDPSMRAQRARELGELLHDHVRYEERELFPAVEAALAGEELERLGAAIAAAHEPTG